NVACEEDAGGSDGADRRPEEREDEHGGAAREAARSVEQCRRPGRPGEPACIGQIRGVEDVERRHGRPGRRTMNASIWSDMFYRRSRSWKRWSGRSWSTAFWSSAGAFTRAPEVRPCPQSATSRPSTRRPPPSAWTL